jgi:hypothetical protein
MFEVSEIIVETLFNAFRRSNSTNWRTFEDNATTFLIRSQPLDMLGNSLGSCPDQVP